MLRVYLICVGRLKEHFYQEACQEYAKRLSPLCRLTILELPEERLPASPSQALIDAALSREAAAIRAKIPPAARVAALCVEGQLRSSEELARMFSDLACCREKSLVFLIGGSYGLDESLKREAQLRLSMSPMTFPHHLARVMLLEQIYRAFQINGGGRYHK